HRGRAGRRGRLHGGRRLEHRPGLAPGRRSRLLLLPPRGRRHALRGRLGRHGRRRRTPRHRGMGEVAGRAGTHVRLLRRVRARRGMTRPSFTGTRGCRSPFQEAAMSTKTAILASVPLCALLLACSGPAPQEDASGDQAPTPAEPAAFAVDVTLSDAARQQFAHSGETVIVSARYYGEPAEGIPANAVNEVGQV